MSHINKEYAEDPSRGGRTMDRIIGPSSRVALALTDNARCVAPGRLYCGAQPGRVDGMLDPRCVPGAMAEIHQSLGVGTFVSLWAQPSVVRAQAQAACSYLGVDMVPLPLAGVEVLEGPDLETVMTALRTVEDPGNWPVYWHCEKGEDRTSMLQACVLEDCGWDAAGAEREVSQYHGAFSWLELGMLGFVRGYGEDLASGRVARPDVSALASPLSPGPAQGV